MRTKIIGSILAWLFPASIFALALPTLYQGEVVVPGYAQEHWQKAVAPALAQVLVKVSGDANVTQISSIRTALSKAGNLVQSYNYAGIDRDGQPMLVLQLRFSPRAVNQLLQQENQPVLPKERAQSLLWLVSADTQGQLTLVNDEHSLMLGLQKEAEKIGIPLLWPSLDLQDLQRVSARQIADFDQTVITAASQRYNPEAVLIGKISQLGNASWHGKWLWIGPGGDQTWETYGATANQAMNNVLSQLRQGMVS